MNDLLKRKYRKALNESYESTEQLIKDLLPDNFNMEDCRWAHNDIVRGATTLYYNNEPIISLFPIEMEEVQKDDGSIIIKLNQQYVSHTKA